MKTGEDTVSSSSTSVTPGTNGVPPFTGFRRNLGLNDKLSPFNRCKSFIMEPWEIEKGRFDANTNSPSSSSFSLAKKVGAEFIGTFILILAGASTGIINRKMEGSESLLGLAISTGLAVAVVILSIGHISGAHLNPSITVAFAVLKHFPWSQVPIYIITQVMASICASFTLKWLLHPIMGDGVTVPTGTCIQAFAWEFIIAFILMFVVTAVSTDRRVAGNMAGIAIGATVMLNILIAGEITGASMNPVRTLGPAMAASDYRGIWVYLLAPFLGAICGAGAYSAIKLPVDAIEFTER